MVFPRSRPGSLATSRRTTVRSAVLLLLAVLVGFSFQPAVVAAAPPETSEKYENTFAKDFVMDAPWRVVDAGTEIPITIIIKDCDEDDVQELHYIRCRDITGGGATVLWYHDFGDERLGDNASEDNYWTYITTVTEGHPSLPNGTALTPANLGYSAGDRIQLEVTTSFKDFWLNHTETRVLRVEVGGGPFPWPADWYGGDTHYHSMYTNNVAEHGAPVPAIARAAEAVGLHWLTVTDHSCDLDETGDGLFSYATHQWEHTTQTASGIQTVYESVFSHGSSWASLGADVAAASGPTLRLIRGVELNLASIDASSLDRTLHCLVYNPDYIHSPWCGAVGERPVSPSLTSGLDQLAVDGFAYAAHPVSNLGSEWGGINWTVNGAVWGDADYNAASARGGFSGLQLFNYRATRQSSDHHDPWSDFDAGALPADPYPNELLAGIMVWDELLRANLGNPPRKVFASGGSDAHGDFNVTTHVGLDSYATNNALGKVQTVVHVPGGYGPGDLPPATEILAAFKAGRSVVTDGPFLELAIDRAGDG
ncbi:MAG: hypothetical protein ABIF77_22215, partial [bacterium]